MSRDRAVVVFDFDLTLTRWDTTHRFHWWLLRRNPWRLALGLCTAPVMLPLLVFKPTRWIPVRFGLWMATLGNTLADLPGLVAQHLDSIPGGHASILIPAAVERLKVHVDRGDQVVIATGCIEPLASILLNRAGFGHVPLVASTLRPSCGGLARRQHCFGQNKVAMLAARGFAPPWSTAYTDNCADMPLLRLSARRYLVSPRPKSLAQVQRALSGNVTVLAWR